MRKLAGLSFALALALGQTGFVVAADNSASNQTTGPDSNNQAHIEQNNNVDINISNNANVKYNIDFDLNTGNNRVSHNTTAGNLTSGDISASLDLATEVNQSGGDFSDVLKGLGGGNNDAHNEKTGPDSNNEVSVQTRNRIDIDVRNRADVRHDIDLDANTGRNVCSHNTKVGDCTSGDINVDIDLATNINQQGFGGAPKENGDGHGPGGPGGVGGGAPRGGQPGPGAAVGGVTTGPIAGVGGAFVAAGSSLLMIFLMLFAAANGLYLLSRKYHYAFHFLTEGKVGKGRN